MHYANNRPTTRNLYCSSSSTWHTACLPVRVCSTWRGWHVGRLWSCAQSPYVVALCHQEGVSLLPTPAPCATTAASPASTLPLATRRSDPATLSSLPPTQDRLSRTQIRALVCRQEKGHTHSHSHLSLLLPACTPRRPATLGITPHRAIARRRAQIAPRPPPPVDAAPRQICHLLLTRRRAATSVRTSAAARRRPIPRSPHPAAATPAHTRQR